MATRKVVQELITKWKYQVDAKQIKKTASLILGLKKNFTEVRKSSVAFGKGEFTRIRRISNGWKGLNRQVTGYRNNLTRTSAAGMGGRGGRGGRGAGSGKASLRQSGSFLLGRLSGSSALTSALLGGTGLAATFGIGAAIRQAGAREQAQTGFTSLLGGRGVGEKPAKQFLDEINKFAVETPFQVTDLRKLSREALGGGFAKEEVLPMLGMLGDVTQGRAPELRRMLTNMVEIRNTQRASLRDVRQFGRAGIPIYEALNKVLGTSGEELGKRITKGQIGLKEINMALKSLTGEGGKFNNLMKDQMDTLIGKASNLGDAFGILGEKMGGPLLGLAKKGILAVSKAVVFMTPHMENLSTGLSKIWKDLSDVWDNSPTFRFAMKALGFILAGAAAWLAPWTALALVIAGIIEDIGAGLNGGDSYFKDFIDWITESIASLKKEINDFMDWVANTPIGKFVGFIRDSAVNTVTNDNRSPLQAPMGFGAGAFIDQGFRNLDTSVKNETNIHMLRPEDLDSTLDKIGNKNLEIAKDLFTETKRKQNRN